MEKSRQRSLRDITKIALAYRYCTKDNEDKRRIVFGPDTVKIGILQDNEWTEYGMSLSDYAIFIDVLLEIKPESY